MIDMRKRNVIRLAGFILFPFLCLTACDIGAEQEEDTAVVHIQAETLDRPENSEILLIPEQVSDAGDSEAETETYPEETEPLAVEGTSNPTEENLPTGGQEEEMSGSPRLSYEILRSVQTDGAGDEVIYAEYPQIWVEGNDYAALSAVLSSLSQEWQEDGEAFVKEEVDWAMEYRESIDASMCFCQEADVDVTRCDADIVSIVVNTCEESGGPHPNYYTYAYNLDVKTGEMLYLSDVMVVDDALRETIRAQLYADYPELDFDDALLRREIAEDLDNNAIDWCFWEGQVSIWFREGSFGFGHAEGSLGVLLPLSG